MTLEEAIMTVEDLISQSLGKNWKNEGHSIYEYSLSIVLDAAEKWEKHCAYDWAINNGEAERLCRRHDEAYSDYNVRILAAYRASQEEKT